MLISIQYPFSDARSFIAESGGRLPLPRWSVPGPEEFVRGFGGVAVRPQGGASIGGEHHQCNARWAFRFDAPGLGRERHCAFRRFYADGNVLAKFEIGIARDEPRGPLIATTQVDLVHKQRASVPMVESVSHPLAELAPVLAHAYLKASTAHRSIEVIAPWWVRAGAPLLFVMHNAKDQLVLPAELKTVSVSRDHKSVRLGHWWQPFRGKLRRVWFLGYEQEDHSLARQMRIDLGRLHCEYESLRMILGHIARGRLLPEPRSELSDRLQRYLNDAITAITDLRSARRNVICETSCRLVEAAAAEMLEEGTVSLVADLEAQMGKLDARPNIRRKVCNYAAEQGREGSYSVATVEARTLRPPMGRHAIHESKGGHLDNHASPPKLLKRHTILFLAANPNGTDRLALGREAHAVQVELERSGYRHCFEFVTRWAVEPLDLLRELRKLRPAVVHFSGHGGQDVMSEHRAGSVPHRDMIDESRPRGSEHRYGLFFQGADGRARAVSTATLEETFSAAGASVKVVVLNACYSEAQAEVLTAHVDCVVGMGSAVHDESARHFAIGFYGGLGERESVAAAYKQGCAAISLEGLRDGNRPQLKVRAGLDATQLILAADIQ